ncbi:MAG: DUF4197 domain-containing protein [Pseudomonadota bacterium]|nr:DUF4197 domain-containing protein [Pseudomonadota bacterium]
MDALLTRRALIGAGLLIPVVTLPGCATGLGGLGLEDAIRRLLTISSQRAFAGLLQENGFFTDELTRIPLPPQLGGNAVRTALSGLLGIGMVQERLLRLVNTAAANAAEAAAPVVYQSIRTMSISDAVSIVRGGPTAATDFLQRSMGNAIFDALFPGIGNALRVVDNGILSRAIQAGTGINFAGLQQHVASGAADAIYRAIGREEAAIRASPASANDPVLAGIFGVLGR